MPQSGAFKTGTGKPARCDSDVCAHMFKRMLGFEWEQLPYEAMAGPYWMKIDERGIISMNLPAAECLLQKL